MADKDDASQSVAGDADRQLIPPPLQYQGVHDSLPQVTHPFGKFLGGVMIGIGAAVIGGMVTGAADHAAPLIIGVAGEFVAGIALVVRSRQQRPLGIGLIAAVPIGLLIFFVGCAFILVVNK